MTRNSFNRLFRNGSCFIDKLRHFNYEFNFNVSRSLCSKIVLDEIVDNDITLYEGIKKDVSVIKPRPLLPVFNLAAYVNKSDSLQQLVKLGVNLHTIEKTRGAPEVILKLDFDKDIKKYIQFLHDLGVPVDDLGNFFTKNPFIFKQDLDNLAVRVNYLESKKFSSVDIVRIVTKNPLWLSFNTCKIDEKLGYFQDKFFLEGSEVRFLAVKMPIIITSDLLRVEENHFSVKEEMGFKTEEIRQLLLSKPKIFILNRKNLVERFTYLHKTMALDHSHILNQPGLLLYRQSKLQERHEFVNAIGRAQYDPNKPGYISPLLLVSGSDIDFCRDVCKVSVVTFNKFLKTRY